ncbi:molybdenum cofactor cytidylyltransferase [Novosphingobium chloroacetimidivorans]|uniref:Molybdenum cofactor cytidylyltransferase n=1 Tax=Novosphingobium chloroacetimidivorans TaxID=1428314 RepID=A0A7W7K8Z4_9SPHN|nr:nucleotidyltransferase family protein [Novosphingobium chloroacetimidivorans]MBB4858416.1 molybdenum cofactor cytidylyltransferase [Novosphingobium chloroacetimidivorans]
MTHAAVVLAAGSARRFGSDKLSADFRGEPLLFHAIRTARQAPVDRVIVVARPGLACGTWPDAPTTDIVRVASEALSDSLKAGLAAAGDVDTLTVFLGDMPLVPPQLAARLAALLDGHYAAMPRQGGRPGHPVVLSRRALVDIASLEGDAGAGKLLRSRNDVAFHDCDDAGIHADVDRPADLERLSITR